MVKLFKAEPFALGFNPKTTALIIIDMQRDFVEPGGFGEALGNDVSLVRTAIEPCMAVLEAAREAGLMVIHTREGHRADLTDCPQAKLTRGGKTFIGEKGPKGRILIRGEQGHDIIPELYPTTATALPRKTGVDMGIAKNMTLSTNCCGDKSVFESTHSFKSHQ